MLGYQGLLQQNPKIPITLSSRLLQAKWCSRQLTTYCIMQGVIAGSQLVAYFDCDDAVAVLSTLTDVLAYALSRKTTTRLEVATGCTVAYITFVEADSGDIDRILGGFTRKGMHPVTLCYIEDPLAQTGILKLTGTGVAPLLLIWYSNLFLTPAAELNTCHMSAELRC